MAWVFIQPGNVASQAGDTDFQRRQPVFHVPNIRRQVCEIAPYGSEQLKHEVVGHGPRYSWNPVERQPSRAYRRRSLNSTPSAASASISAAL